MPHPRTVLYVMHFPDESEYGIGELYERQGAFEVTEQMTSWFRECAVKFYNNVQEETHPSGE